MKAFRTTIALIIAMGFILTTSCRQSETKIPGESDGNGTPVTNFNFVFRYGITSGNKLDTFRGTFKKDMILAPDITINLRLTEDELAQILTKMQEIDFFNYPDVYKVEVPPGELTMMVTPYSSYYFKVEFGSVTKELRWEDEIRNENEKADRLRELISLIKSIIESKEEYKNLPEPRGGYM